MREDIWPSLSSQIESVSDSRPRPRAALNGRVEGLWIERWCTRGHFTLKSWAFLYSNSLICVFHDVCNRHCLCVYFVVVCVCLYNESPVKLSVGQRCSMRAAWQVSSNRLPLAELWQNNSAVTDSQTYSVSIIKLFIFSLCVSAAPLPRFLLLHLCHPHFCICVANWHALKGKKTTSCRFYFSLTPFIRCCRVKLAWLNCFEMRLAGLRKALKIGASQPDVSVLCLQGGRAKVVCGVSSLVRILHQCTQFISICKPSLFLLSSRCRSSFPCNHQWQWGLSLTSIRHLTPFQTTVMWLISSPCYLVYQSVHEATLSCKLAVLTDWTVNPNRLHTV